MKVSEGDRQVVIRLMLKKSLIPYHMQTWIRKDVCVCVVIMSTPTSVLNLLVVGCRARSLSVGLTTLELGVDGRMASCGLQGQPFDARLYSYCFG